DKKHREHQRGAIAVLKALLPEPGTKIKGQMRSVAQLREVAGYANRPQDFLELMYILYSELRLLTPAGRDSNSASSESHSDVQPIANDERCYQLTHDYLVHALREWLPRKQQETRRGRATLLLESQASYWNSLPDNRFLPSAREYLVIRTLTNRRDW